MKHTLWLACALLGVSAGIASSGPQRRSKPTAAPAAAAPSDANQFTTVDDFVKAARAKGTAASVEGYIVLATRTADGSVRAVVVDSVDHVLNAKDANAFARTGAAAIIPASSIKKHASWGLTARGLQRLAMYTGAKSAQKQLHDTVAKVRITGRTAGKAVLNPVTKVEYQDDNGDWKIL